MFDKDYILEELRNGRDYEEIMDEISNVLNEAAKEFDTEQQENYKRQSQIGDMQEIIDLAHDYFIEYYGTENKDIDEINKAFKNVKAEEIVELFDNCLKLANSLTDLDQMFNLGKKTKSDPKGEIEVNVEIEPDKILSDFLKLLK